MSVALSLQYFLRVWLISVISPRPLSGQTPAKTATDQNKLFSSVSVSPTSPSPSTPLPSPTSSPCWSIVISSLSCRDTLTFIFQKATNNRKKCVLLKSLVTANYFYLNCVKWSTVFRVCYVVFVMVGHLKSVCSNLSIYMFDLVGVKRQWLLCILWLLRGMQIDDISWYNNSNRNTLYLWDKQHQRNLLLTHTITAINVPRVFSPCEYSYKLMYYYILYWAPRGQTFISENLQKD